MIALKKSERKVELPNKIIPIDYLISEALAEAIVSYNQTGKTNPITKILNQVKDNIILPQTLVQM